MISDEQKNQGGTQMERGLHLYQLPTKAIRGLIKTIHYDLPFLTKNIKNSVA
jgi:hypothetical protein